MGFTLAQLSAELLALDSTPFSVVGFGADLDALWQQSLVSSKDFLVVFVLLLMAVNALAVATVVHTVKWVSMFVGMHSEARILCVAVVWVAVYVVRYAPEVY